jgi:predicted amidophosphoribosyltransferase
VGSSGGVLARAYGGPVLASLLDALFPPRCAGCGGGAWPFCDRCHAALDAVEPPWCRRCHRPTESDVAGCAWCPPPPVAAARAPFLYRGPVRGAIHRLKFAGWRSVADALGGAMAASTEPIAIDAVCWVPLPAARLARRGYDQAAALADAVASRLSAPCRGLLRRVGDAGVQAARAGADRRAAMVGAFAAAAGGPVPARVLLVDDVLTTGATASACAAALAEAGARRVVLLTAARAIPGRLPARYTRAGIPSGSVVAPGKGSPVVDASRGRNDPRKVTLGR